MVDDQAKRCYICHRTEEEVKAYFKCTDPDESFVDTVETLFTTLPICFGCNELLTNVAITHILEAREEIFEATDMRMSKWLSMLADKIRCEELPE